MNIVDNLTYCCWWNKRIDDNKKSTSKQNVKMAGRRSKKSNRHNLSANTKKSTRVLSSQSTVMKDKYEVKNKMVGSKSTPIEKPSKKAEKFSKNDDKNLEVDLSHNSTDTDHSQY